MPPPPFVTNHLDRPNQSLIDDFRESLKDTAQIQQAITFAVNDPQASMATLEKVGSMLVFTCSGGGLRPFTLDLSTPNVSTLEKLRLLMARTQGIVANLDKVADPTHSSLDIADFPPISVLRNSYVLKTHIHSDEDITRILRTALRLHNPSMGFNQLPSSEVEMVKLRGMVTYYQERATGADKLRGSGQSVQDLLALAATYETSYQALRRTHARVVKSPHDPNPGEVRTGDVLVGSFVRENLRTGRMTPFVAALPPTALKVAPQEVGDLEDEAVTVRWDRTSDETIYSIELWKDSQPDVVRNVKSNRSGQSGQEVEQSTTSELVMTTGTGRRTNEVGISFGNFGRVPYPVVPLYRVENLEPETTYYFALYSVSQNGEVARSEVVELTTLSLRSRIYSLSLGAAEPGQLVTVILDSTFAPATLDCKLQIGEKLVVFTVIGDYAIQFAFPTFRQKGKKNVVLTSANGLKHVRAEAIEAR